MLTTILLILGAITLLNLIFGSSEPRITHITMESPWGEVRWVPVEDVGVASLCGWRR